LPLSWNEIKTRAAAFVLEWKEKAPSAREEADAQTFENGFFNIFGISRSKVAVFEKKVRMKDGADSPGLFDETGAARGYIDLFWKGHIIIEMKSPGKDLGKAYEQAKGYANALSPADLPRGILICDFVNFHYYNLEEDAKLCQFTLAELPQHIELFGYLAGYANVEYKQFDPVNIEAAENMGRLHDRLKEIGYSGHQLEVYLVRLLFCLFADDTGIFEWDHFVKYIVQRTNPDGSDLAMHIEKIFEVLNKPPEKRLKTIDEQLNQFPFINGHLFEERLETADFDSAMRDALLNCCRLDWSKISPAIFGAMFQSVMNDEERHNIGAHYTSEENILKLIHPLFLDELRGEFEKIKTLSSDIRKERLAHFHDKLASLKFLDPACGCGNFLVISYRELRMLEFEVIQELLGNDQLLDIHQYIKVNVDQFYGIEIEEFPAKIAQTALWLMDHQMNMRVQERFGQYYLRIPLLASPSIHCANALTLDWESIVPKAELSYIMGNPPFLGSRIMNREQKGELEKLFGGLKNSGELDYVTCWYLKAAQYIQGTAIEVSFVSTNSICQGLQVPILWKELLYKYGIKINFSHQTFKWSNEARGKAAVYCIIIGIGLSDRKEKKLYHYASVTGKPVETIVNHINPYLVDALDIFIESRGEPLCAVPPMNFGNMPADGGEFLFTTEEKEDFLSIEPEAFPFFHRFISANEFINNKERWCLWLVDIEPNRLKKLKHTLQRVDKVKKIRMASARPHLANTPHLFAQITQPKGKDFILIPRHSSENRKYIPIGFFAADNVAADSCLIVPDGTLYHFGVLTSAMHMAWMRQVCGRLEMRYRYSKDIVYNNFPWPSPVEKQEEAIEEAAQSVLNARALFPKSSLADLYGPLTMPPLLVKAHQKLDGAVEKAYGRKFDDDSQRVAYLFELYQKLAGELFVDANKRGKGRKN
jgi:hypothetical protein